MSSLKWWKKNRRDPGVYGGKWGLVKDSLPKEYQFDCTLALYTRYFPKLGEQNHWHITQVGFEPMT